MRATLHDQCIFHLAGGHIEDSLYGNMTPQEALMALKNITSQDFGYDIEAWKKWFKENDLDTAYQGLTRHAKKKHNRSNKDE